MIQIEESTLETELTLVRLALEGTRSVTILVAFDAGARTERAEENGMAHFLEHLVFKGGEKYATYRQVNDTAERLGAQINAYTSHDLVAFHVTCRSEAIADAVDLLTDFVARARLDPDELERERGVVIQEIARYLDQPSSIADILLDRAGFGEHPLGRPVLGPVEHIRSFSRDDIIAFRERRWAPSRGGAFLAGELTHADEARLHELFARFRARPEPPAVDAAPSFERRVLVERRETNQSHLRLQWRAQVEPRELRQRAAFAVYSTLLGGSMGSRLFDEIREQRGLCYAIRSFGLIHADVASLDVSSGLESGNCLEAYARIKDTVQDLADHGPRRGELERSRAYAAGSAVLALESSAAVARRAAADKVNFGVVTPPEEWIAALDGVEADDVRQVAAQIEGEPAVACVGPHEAADFE